MTLTLASVKPKGDMLCFTDGTHALVLADHQIISSEWLSGDAVAVAQVDGFRYNLTVNGKGSVSASLHAAPRRPR